MEDDETSREVRSEELRRNLRQLLNSVEREDVHVTIKRYDEPVAVIVPIDWYRAVKDADVQAFLDTERKPGRKPKDGGQMEAMRKASDAELCRRNLAGDMQD